MSDDKKPNPDDVPIVTSLDEITADGPVLWTSDIGTPVGLAWRGEAIPEADAQAAWDRFHEPAVRDE